MSPQLLIIGTGKMAKDIGSFFLKNGCHVSWLTRSTERINPMEKFIKRISRRIFSETSISDIPKAGVYLLDDENIKQPDFIIESTEEALSVKVAAIDKIRHFLNRDAWLCSNSSSLLPSQIDMHCIGTHFFHPIQKNRFFELIMPGHIKPDSVRTTTELFERFNLESHLQNENNAFLSNRLLLPLQTEAVRAVVTGYPASIVDECSNLSCFHAGQLFLMDSIGLDVIFYSVQNYVSRMTSDKADEYTILLETLSQMLDAGKTGNKANDGFLCGAPLPYPQIDVKDSDREQLGNLFEATFLNSCCNAIETRQTKKNEIDLILKHAFQSKYSLDRINSQNRNYRSLLIRLHKKRGLSYFRPSDLIQ